MTVKEKAQLSVLLDTTCKKRIEILKFVLGSFRKVTITGCYGASEVLDDSALRDAVFIDSEIKSGEEIIISTSICTG